MYIVYEGFRLNNPFKFIWIPDKPSFYNVSVTTELLCNDERKKFICFGSQTRSSYSKAWL